MWTARLSGAGAESFLSVRFPNSPQTLTAVPFLQGIIKGRGPGRYASVGQVCKFHLCEYALESMTLTLSSVGQVF